MKTKLSVCVLLGLSLLGMLPAPAEAQSAFPPAGLWVGVSPDGSSTLTLYLRADGTAGYLVNGVGTTGIWNWYPTSAVGGIVTIRYLYAGIPSQVSFRVTYVNGCTILVSAPGVMVVLRRC